MNFQLSLAVRLAFCIAFFLIAQPQQSLATDSGDEQEETLYMIAYSVSNLPVWRVDEAGELHFDASVLVSHIRSNVAPESWERNARIIPDDESPVLGPLLLVEQTRENHRLLSRLIRRLSAFAQHDASKKVAKKVSNAKIANQNVLLFIGDPDARCTRQFFDLQYGENTGVYFDSYIVQCVNANNRDFLRTKGIEATGNAMVVVISGDGDLIAKADIDNFTRNDSVNGELLGAFLDSHRPTFPDAEVQIQAAIAQAKCENKKVFVQVGGPGCGPCIPLSRYLAKHADMLSKDYVLVKLDSRMPHADEATRRLGKEFRGVPWMAILSESGEPLITSESRKGNIAFPRTEEQKSHFRQMLESTSSRLSNADVEALLAALPKSKPTKLPAD